MDAGYGADTDLRTNITALGLSYVAGIMPQTSVWAPGTGPQPPELVGLRWTYRKLLRRDGKHQPISVKKLAFALPSKAWRKITWREATAEPLSSRGARVRVRAAHRDYWLAESRPEEWLLIEWPEGEEAPTKYWFSTLPANIAFHQLVDTAKLRWRIERDYQELEQEVGSATSRGEEARLLPSNGKRLFTRVSEVVCFRTYPFTYPKLASVIGERALGELNSPNL